MEKVFTQEDIEKNKNISAVAYILFFLPLVTCKDSAYGRFHANQGLVLLILSIAGSVLLSVIDSFINWRLWWLTSLLSTVWGIVILILIIIGIRNALNGRADKLPIIGNISILK